MLERYDRLASVAMARNILRNAFGLELVLTGFRGPMAHHRGGVMASSSEICRAALFSRKGFRACDRFYRDVFQLEGKQATKGGALGCHLGLSAIFAPVVVDGEVLLHVVASGFDADGLKGIPQVDKSALVRDLNELTDGASDAAQAAQHLPVIKGDRARVVQSILRSTAESIRTHEDAERRRRKQQGSEGPVGFWGIVGDSPQMHRVFDHLTRVGASNATVLVIGESGTGKEVVARALVENGPRSNMPFIAQSCGALSDELLESTLFGHVRGAFSGAIRSSTGLFGAADGGTLFLDEVSEMSPSLQVKLLRVLQDRTYFPLGATSPRSIDVRIIAASRYDLGALVEAGRFRQDLYYRLHVLTVQLPPLRDRSGDARLLVDKFLAEVEDAPAGVSDAAWACLEKYHWPGNVRELRAEVERWAVSGGDASTIGPEHLSQPIRSAGGYIGDSEAGAAVRAAQGQATLAEAVEALERAIIRRGLERNEGNRTRLAKELDISRTTLGERLKKYDLDQ